MAVSKCHFQQRHFQPRRVSCACSWVSCSTLSMDGAARGDSDRQFRRVSPWVLYSCGHSGSSTWTWTSPARRVEPAAPTMVSLSPDCYFIVATNIPCWGWCIRRPQTRFIVLYCNDVFGYVGYVRELSSAYKHHCPFPLSVSTTTHRDCAAAPSKFTCYLYVPLQDKWQ